MPNLAAALIVSASHNPAEDNGIKLFDQKNGKITIDDEQAITHYFYGNSIIMTHEQGSSTELPYARELYKQSLMQLFAHVRADHHHIVLDTAHGATSSYAESLFKATGARVSIIHNTPDGYNINLCCGSTFPHSLQEAVRFHGATLGFAFDGDGDRVIAVNKRGEIKHGDDILCLLLNHPHYEKSEAVVGTIMTNEGFAQHLSQQRIHLIRTAVGDRNISDMLQQKKLLLGGEPTGHTILKNHLYTGDGLLVALKVLETIVATNNTELITFKHYPQVAHKIFIKKRYNLYEEPFASIVEHARESCQNGRVVVRYSGTEPILRVMVETTDLAQAEKQCTHLAQKLEMAHNRSSYA
jgi:phosphoglucosamine mutase